MSAHAISNSQAVANASTKQRPSLVMGVVVLMALGTLWGWLLGVGNSTQSTANPPATQILIPPVSSEPVAAVTASPKAMATKNMQTGAPIPEAPTTSAQVSPRLNLKLETALHSVAFASGRVHLTASEKTLLGEHAKANRFAEAAKIHLQGRSGGTTLSAGARHRLAFGRAWSVKESLVNDFGVEPSKVRMFTFTIDHYGTPRVDVAAFETLEAATEDAKTRLVKK